MKKLFIQSLLLISWQFGLAQHAQKETRSLKVEKALLQGGVAQLQRAETFTESEEPVYIVDGMPVDGDEIKNIIPEDIISIEVLKNRPEAWIGCNYPKGGIIVIKTINGLSRRESRKMKRDQKKSQRIVAKNRS